MWNRACNCVFSEAFVPPEPTYFSKGVNIVRSPALGSGWRRGPLSIAVGSRFSTRPCRVCVVASGGMPPFHLVTRLEAGGNNSFSRPTKAPGSRLSLDLPLEPVLTFPTGEFLLSSPSELEKPRTEQETDCLRPPAKSRRYLFFVRANVPRKALTSSTIHAAIFSLMRFSKSSTLEVVFIVARSGIARVYIYIYIVGRSSEGEHRKFEKL